MSVFQIGLLTSVFSVLFSLGAVGQVKAADADDAYGSTGNVHEGLYIGIGLGTGGSAVDFKGIGKKGSSEIDHKNFIPSGIIGYNHMAGNWLIGIEGDISKVKFDKTGAVTALGNVSVDSDWVGSVALRGGYAIDNLLLFGSGGVATTDFDISSSLGGKKDKKQVGLVLGIGAEYAINENFSLRGELLGYTFEDKAVLGGTSRDYNLGHGVARIAATFKF